MTDQRIDGRILYARFASAWGRRFVENHPTEDFVGIWCDDWSRALAGISRDVILTALDECRLTMDWPPVLSEFLRMCDQHNGLPSLNEAYEKALRRDFAHPAIQKAFSAIPSWDWTHDTEKDLRRKFAAAWKKAVDGQRGLRLLEQGEGSNGLESRAESPGATRVRNEKSNMARHVMDCLPGFDGKTHESGN